MGRRDPIPGDEPRILLHRPEIEAIRAALVTALEIIDRAYNNRVSGADTHAPRPRDSGLP